MIAADVVNQIASKLPLYTERFTTTVGVESITLVGSVATVRCKKKHGVVPGHGVVLVGAFTPIVVTPTRLGAVGTIVTATNHDMTPKTHKTVTLSGSNDVEFNGTFTILQIVDKNTITFTMADAGPTSTTGSPILEDGESILRSWDGAYEVKSTPSETEFTIDQPTSIPDPIGTIQARVRPRVAATATPGRIPDVYTEKFGNEAWLFVVLEDVQASKDRGSRADGVANRTAGTNLRQQIIQPFSLYVYLPTRDQIAGRSSADDARLLFRPICRSILGHAFDSQLYVGTQGKVQFVSHGTFSYDTAVYAHAFAFEQTVDLDFEDSVGPEIDVAFRVINLNLFPDLPGGAGTGVEFLIASPRVDEPA